MVITKGISIWRIITWSWYHIVWLSACATIIALLYHYKILGVSIPWVPVSVIGTAVAFYVGFKNNSAYDRMWEARKIWGAIVNSSRAWGTYVDGFVTNQFSNEKKTRRDRFMKLNKGLSTDILRGCMHCGVSYWLPHHGNTLAREAIWQERQSFIRKSSE